MGMIEKEELKASGIMEAVSLVAAGVNAAQHRAVVVQGQLSAFQDMVTHYELILSRLNDRRTAGELGDDEVARAKSALAPMGDELASRIRDGHVEMQRLEGEMRGYQRLGADLSSRLKMVERRIELARAEAEETALRKEEREDQ